MKGFTLIELLISMTTFVMLLGVITLNLNTAQHKASIETTLDILMTDLGQQQIKAMVGDTEGRTLLDTYGLHFNTTSYTLFHGTYSSVESTNFLVPLPTIFQVTTTFPNAQVVFQKGSGDVSCFVDLTCSGNTQKIILTDTTNNQQKTITINRYGVITEVN